jgi:Uma2 family endonuclease
MELRETDIVAIVPENHLQSDDFDAGVVPPTGDQLLALARHNPVYIRTRMSKEAFHQFLLQNSDWKIERDKHGTITIHPLMTLKSAYNEGDAFGYLWYWSKSNQLGKAYSPSATFDLPDGSTCWADGAWISMEQLAHLTPEEEDSIAMIVPDFVMEVRSKTDSLAKLKKKMTESWMANGVQLAWLIDPRRNKAWIYRAGQPEEEVSGPDLVLSGETVLPGFTLALKDI